MRGLAQYIFILGVYSDGRFLFSVSLLSQWDLIDSERSDGV